MGSVKCEMLPFFFFFRKIDKLVVQGNGIYRNSLFFLFFRVFRLFLSM